jgi:mannose-6-phosphate isomerase-like protein (cupin superfamily)
MLLKVDIKAKLGSFDERWVPKIVAELNGHLVKVVKFEGEYVWHQHADEDEMFLVLEGEIDIHLRDGVVHLAAGQLVVVPRGVEHKPVAERLAHVALVEPRSVRNTGGVDCDYTIEAEDLERI